jgi:outer membrane receptor protein involved in Fe transport
MAPHTFQLGFVRFTGKKYEWLLTIPLGEGVRTERSAVMLRRRTTFLITAVIFSLVLPAWLGSTEAWSQVTGSVQGTIRDSESGEFLDYANVLIKGTTRGTMSLGGGVFYFKGLPPGQYTIQVLYLGYAPEEQTVNLQPGQTANLSFDMKVVIVETLGAFDVDAEVYMVEIKNTAAEQKIDSDTFQKYAIDSVEDALAKQAGIVSRAGELYVRGGRSGEVSFRIDNVPVDDPLGGRSLQVSPLAVEAISTVTGGLDAEFGNALSGVVNITTRTGGDEFEGGLRYMTDDFGRQDKTYTNFDRFEYGFGGPTPIQNLTYYFSGDLQFTDTENYSVANRPEFKVNIGDATLFKFRRRQFNSARGSTKWAYQFSEDFRMTGEYTYSRTSQEFYAPNWSVSGYSQRVIYLPEVWPIPGDDSYLNLNRSIPVYYGPWYETMLSRARPAAILDPRGGSFNREIAPILEVRGVDGRMYMVIAEPSYDGFRYPYSSYSTVAEDSSYTWFNSANNRGRRARVGQQGTFAVRHNLTDDTFYNLRLSLVSFDTKFNVNDKDPWEYIHGGIGSPGPFFGQRDIYQYATDYYTDPLNPLFITTSDFPQYNEEYSRQYSMIFDLTTNRWEGHLVKTGLQIVYNDLERFNLDAPAIERQNRFTGEFSLGQNRNIFHTFNPEASWFIQDRWEYEGMVVNYGFRWDMFSPGSAAEILLRNEDVDRNVIKYKTQFSPRLGFAFPITERDGFHFHYGRFIQFPSREILFASQDPIGASGILGNPNLEAETTVSYQAGIKHQFTDHLAGTFNVYSKDIFDLIASTTVTDPETGNTLARYINKAYASARGIEVTLSKRFSNNFMFDITYTFAYADGVASEQEFGSNPEGLEFLPTQELPLDWDQRHTFNFSLALEEPGAWSGSFTFTYGSGLPWTPVDRYARRQDPLLENSRRLPSTFSLDIQAERQVNFYGQRLTLYLQGFNLINQDQVFSPAAGIFPGMNNAQSAYLSYLTETGKFGGAYLQDANGDNFDEFIPIHDPRVFDQHRLFRIGIGWQF